MCLPYTTDFHNVNELKQWLNELWCTVEQDVIDVVTDQWFSGVL